MPPGDLSTTATPVTRTSTPLSMSAFLTCRLRFPKMARLYRGSRRFSASMVQARMVGLAQSVRAPLCGSGGRGFKSPNPPQILHDGLLRGEALSG